MNHDSGTDCKTKINDAAVTHYTMEELLPIVGHLAEKYTSHEHTSVSYETAEMLMEAVLYCIREAEAASCGALPAGALSAKQAYAAGAAAVREKVNAALCLYNEIIPEFTCYENRCLQDTFVKGIPAFFKWYDIRFRPQDTILTLDYPILRNLSEYSGIDRIYEYILCIRLEQEFLSMFPEDYVILLLSQSSEDYRDMTENLCETFLMSLARRILDREPLTEHNLWEDDCCREDTDSRQNNCCREDADSRQNNCCREDDDSRQNVRMSLQELQCLLRDRLTAFLQTQYGGNDDRSESSKMTRLADYLSGAIDDIAVRLINAV